MHQGVVEPDGRRVHVTGQVAWDETGQVLHHGDAHRQTHAAFDNIAKVLAAAGGNLDDIVSMTTYLVRREDWSAISTARAERLSDATGPASTAVMVSGLADPELLVELQVVAVIPEARFKTQTESG
ncbi:MAG: RidA family protein [Pseudomonadota bacterium]